jgi:hypothetical protein
VKKKQRVCCYVVDEWIVGRKFLWFSRKLLFMSVDAFVSLSLFVAADVKYGCFLSYCILQYSLSLVLRLVVYAENVFLPLHLGKDVA